MRVSNKWAKEFLVFHEENPSVYALFDEIASDMLKRGYKRFGADAIMMQIVWKKGVETNDKKFKINHNLVPYYARYWMEKHPDHDGFFRTRKVKKEPIANAA